MITYEIIYTIKDYLKPKLIERYHLGRLNKTSYQIYKQELLNLINIAYPLINNYSPYSIDIFNQYLSVVIHQANVIYKSNLQSAEYLDHIYDNNFIVIYIDDKLQLIKKEFKNCYDIQIVKSSASDRSIHNKENTIYCYILYDSYGIYHYGLSEREAYSIGLAIKQMIKL